MNKLTLAIAFLALAIVVPALRAGDWPQWGGTPSRNMVSPETGLPVKPEVGDDAPESEEKLDRSKAKSVKWMAKLGNQAYGNPTVGGGKIFVGTNNGNPRDPAIQGDFGAVMCFNEKSGEFLWQLLVPKLGAGQVSDWEYVGVCSSPTVDGDHVYVVTNRCEVLCL